MFLRSRSEQVVPNGCAVLILHGRQSPDPSSKEWCAAWGLIAGAIAALVSEVKSQLVLYYLIQSLVYLRFVL